MKYVLILIIALIFFCITRKEKFSEIFASAGYSKPITDININENNINSIDISSYEEKAALISNDLLQELLFTVQKQMKLPTYGIETGDIKKFVNKTDPSKIIYRCRFMFLYTKGFPFGFGVTADIMMAPKPTIIAMTTQPQSNQTEQNIKPFTEECHDNFVNYNEIIS